MPSAVGDRVATDMVVTTGAFRVAEPFSGFVIWSSLGRGLRVMGLPTVIDNKSVILRCGPPAIGWTVRVVPGPARRLMSGAPWRGSGSG